MLAGNRGGNQAGAHLNTPLRILWNWQQIRRGCKELAVVVIVMPDPRTGASQIATARDGHSVTDSELRALNSSLAIVNYEANPNAV
jgi:hypothetical protein